MNAELAQVAALVAHAKVALALSDPGAFLTVQNSTFKFVHAVSFEREQRRLLRSTRVVSVGASPSDWYRYLASCGASQVELALWSSPGELPDHVAAGFSGGGSWGIRTRGPRRTSLWRGLWEPDRRDDPSNRIWSVVYREFSDSGPPGPSPPIREASEGLCRLLGQAEQLARDADLSMWAEWFGVALQRASASHAVFDYHPDILPPTGYAEAARVLLSACEKAWAFGGMGSWNDVGFEDPDLEARYRDVTPKLYSAVLVGIAASVNSFQAASL